MGFRPPIAAAWVLAWLALPGPPAAAQEAPEKLRDSGIIERTDAVLAQIDVTVLGAAEILRSLTEDDFRIKINTTRILEFTLDRVCPEIDAPAASDEPSTGESGSRSLAAQANYLLYFDQAHLTLAGRAQSVDTAREMIPLLTRDGAQAMIVSNAERLFVFEPLTRDADRLVAAIDRMEKDRTHWMTFAEHEDDRVDEVMRTLNEKDRISAALAKARRYQKQEIALTDRSMRRLRLTMTRLGDLPPPKAVIYFGDTLRRNPGGHYLSIFGHSVQTAEVPLGGMEASALLGGLSFDAAVNEASAQGVRFYTIQAEGLMERMQTVLAGSTAMAQTRTSGAPRSIRSRSARDTLRGMAAETGGESFVQGASGTRIGERILTDSGCVFLISFDPAGFRYDQPLRTKVTTPRDDIELRVRGRLIVQSPSAKRTSSLLRAFGSPDSIEDPFELRSQLVPTGFENGRYTALLQISVPGTPLQSATWELGASVVHRDKIHDEASARMTVNAPGIPVVLEHEMRFGPGDYEIVSVAHEARTGMISSMQQDLAWPDPDGQAATAAPIAMLQPADAVFVREGNSRSSGSLARARGEWIDPGLPLALVAVVCRGRRDRGPLQIERALVGESVVELPPLELDMAAERCAQLRDVIPAGTLGAGRYRYRITSVENDIPVELAHIEFSVPDGR